MISLTCAHVTNQSNGDISLSLFVIQPLLKTINMSEQTCNGSSTLNFRKLQDY